MGEHAAFDPLGQTGPHWFRRRSWRQTDRRLDGGIPIEGGKLAERARLAGRAKLGEGSNWPSGAKSIEGG